MMRLRSKRSAAMPASGASANAGMNSAKNSSPSQIGWLWESSTISPWSPMCEIQKPV